MNVPNIEKKAFRDLTAEERSAIVEAWVNDSGEIWNFAKSKWQHNTTDLLSAARTYRTRQRTLTIPWEVIKPEYKWAAMDMNGSVWVYENKPELGCDGWVSVMGLKAANTIDALNIDTTDIDWRESLVERPEGV